MIERRIWKYPLLVTAEEQTIQVPAGARVLRIDSQGGLRSRNWCFWAEVPVSRSVAGVVIPPTPEPRRLIVLPTGATVPDGFTWWTTFLEAGGTFCWHVYVPEDDFDGVGVGVSRESEAFSALDSITAGEWDRYLLRLRAAINQRLETEGYRAHVVAMFEEPS